MVRRMIDKDMILGAIHYVFDGLLVFAVWMMHKFHIPPLTVVWNQTFGEYADVVQAGLKVLLTIVIALTAFYRLRIMILKYKREKKNEDKPPEE